MKKRYQTICTRMAEMVAAIEAEKRSFDENEQAEFNRLGAEKLSIESRSMAESRLNVQPDGIPCDADAQLRSRLLDEGRKATIVLSRAMTTDNAAEAGVIAVQQQQLVKPLYQGLIYDKLGLTVPVGLPGQTLRWAKHSKAVAAWGAEGAKATETAIDFDKLEVKPEKLTVNIPVTREDLEGSEGIVERVITEEMPMAVTRAINDALFTTETGGRVTGPFASAGTAKVNFASVFPTRKELLRMKSKVAASGCEMLNCAWVMTENMKAELEDTKVDSGSGRFVCENDRILGYPVFTTNAIGEAKVGFGDFSYLPAGFFGGMNVIVDPYTLAAENAVRFILHTHFNCAVLQDEAFVLGVGKA